MKKILITGGSGFIGSNYVHYCIQKYSNNQITVLDKLTYAGNINNIIDLINTKKIKFIQGDIADKNFIKKVFFDEKFNIVINFAAETHVDKSIDNPDIFVNTNIVGTNNLLLESMRNDVDHYHQISTDEVYGDLGNNSINYFTENMPINPSSPYAASKAASDVLALSYYKTYKFPVTISRCSNNYGPYQFPEKLIPYFFQLALQNKSLPVYGDGKNIRDWLYVEDHCCAIDLILKSKKYGEVYNIGGNNEYTNIEITKFILKFLDKSDKLITFVKDRNAHDRRYAIDSTKIKKELNWKPLITFEEGIQKTFEWYNNNRVWLKNAEFAN